MPRKYPDLMRESLDPEEWSISGKRYGYGDRQYFWVYDIHKRKEQAKKYRWSRKIKPYGWRLKEIRSRFHRNGHKHMSPARFSALLGMTIYRYWQLEENINQREIGLVDFLYLWVKINYVLRHYGLEPLKDPIELYRPAGIDLFTDLP